MLTEVLTEFMYHERCFLTFFIIYKKRENYYRRNRDLILNRTKDYHRNDQERLREQARQKLI